MKLRRKLFTMLLACVILVAMAVPAFAAESGSITIQNTVDGKTYDLYKIFDLTQSGDKVAYTIDSDWNDFFTGSGEGASFLVTDNTGKLNQVTVNGATKYINITDSNVAEFAKEALSYAAKKTADKTVTGTGGAVTKNELELGYYLIYPRGAADAKEANGSVCSLTSTTPAATVSIKSDYPTITKTVNDANPEIGQTITYTITGQVPDTTGYDTYTYEVKDNMSSGLTYNDDVKVKINESEVSVNTVTDNTINNGFHISIDVKNQQTNVGKDIVITYTAAVNKDATVGSTGNANEAVLIYSNNPSDSNSKTTNPPVVVKVHTAKLVIDKVDGAAADKSTDSAKLAGAKFVLKNTSGNFYKYANDTVSWVTDQSEATVVTTNDSGAASFNGLENGTYSLVETEAPKGYNKLTNPVSVTIDYANDSANAGQTTQVENLSGTELPSTGGIGTTIFYILGGILVVGAGVVLVVRRRVNAEK